MSTHEPYDFDDAISKARAAMKKTDLLTLSTLGLARSVADHIRDEFPVEQQTAVARGLILAIGCVGSQLQKVPVHRGEKYLAVVMLNVQAVAGVMILDQLEIELLEASLEAEL